MAAVLKMDMTMAEVLAGWSGAGAVLARRGMACVGCTMAPFETIAEAARAYGCSPEELLRELSGARRREETKRKRRQSRKG